MHTHRYAKQVPGHHVQVDVKFLTLYGPAGRRIRRYQYTAIDDATRIRALRAYRRHTQQNAIAFIDHVVGKFPFRIHTIRTDRGHEFQALFHWHVADVHQDLRLSQRVEYLPRQQFVPELPAERFLVARSPTDYPIQ